MDKSNGIEIVQGDKLEAEFYLVGSTPISKYFVTKVELANGYTYYDSEYGSIRKDGATVFTGTASLKIAFVYASMVNICVTLDQYNIINIPSALTKCFQPGYYSYDIVCKYEGNDLLTPVYCNTLSIFDRKNEFTPAPDPEPITSFVEFSNTFSLSSGTMTDLTFIFTIGTIHDGRAFYSDTDAQGFNIGCSQILFNGYANDGSDYTLSYHIGSTSGSMNSGNSKSLSANETLVIDSIVCNK